MSRRRPHPSRANDAVVPLRGLQCRPEVVPGDGQLVCPYCGTTNDVGGEQATEAVEELDLDAMLAAAPTGWSAEVSEIQVRAVWRLHDCRTPRHRQQLCILRHHQLDLQPQEGDVIQPKSLLPFAIEQGMARRGFGAWVKEACGFVPATSSEWRASMRCRVSTCRSSPST